jgi:probable rRNA maturation factor
MNSPLAITLTITSNERIRELNKQFADKDEVTDVLSFGPEDSPYAVEPGDPPYYGDVIIAYPFAEQQSGQGGHPVVAELQLLVVHGTLHLLGYDHDTPDRQAEMWALQSQAMDMVRTTRI